MDVAKRLAIKATIEEIAEHLSGDWEMEPFPDDWGRDGAYLREQHSQAILAIGESQVYSDRHKNLLTVSTDYPKDHEGKMSSASRPKISVSGNKTGTQIARDIERRLLPEYLPILEKELASNRSWNEFADKTTAVAQQIARLVKVALKPRETTVSFYHSPFKMLASVMSEAQVVNENEVDLHLRLDVNTAITLLNQLKSM
jgi:hypothetical protein